MTPVSPRDGPDPTLPPRGQQPDYVGVTRQVSSKSESFHLQIWHPPIHHAAVHPGSQLWDETPPHMGWGGRVGGGRGAIGLTTLCMTKAGCPVAIY